MAIGSQLVSRITQQRRLTQGMLSPGRKNGPGSMTAPLSPVAADFAGRKFQLAAKKMRVLGADRIGTMLPRMETTLSADIRDKFRDIEKIIHINPRTIRDGSIWSEVETTFPGSGQPVQQTASPASSMLQQGSVIKKFSTVPKPGQSLESFRQQIESQPRPVRPTISKKKKAALLPGDRLFSHVQEISQGQKIKGIDLAEVSPPSEKPIEKSTPEVAAPLKNDQQTMQQPADTSEIIRRQFELSDVEIQSEEIAEVLPEKEPNAEVKTGLPASKDPVRAVQQEEAVEVSQELLPSPTTSSPPVQKALPVDKKPEQKPVIEKAKLVRKNTTSEKQVTLKKAHPIVSPTIQRDKGSVVQRQSLPSPKNPPVKAGKAVRVSQEVPVERKTKAEKAQPDNAKVVSHNVDLLQKTLEPAMPVVHKEQEEYFKQVDDDTTSRSETAIPNRVEEESGQDMPLRQVLAERRQAAVSAVRRAEPAKMKKVQMPKLTHIVNPIIMLQKARSTPVARTMAEMPAARQSQSGSRPGGPQTISSGTYTPQMGFQPLPLDDSDMEQPLLEMPVVTREAGAQQVKASEVPETKSKKMQQSARNLPSAPAVAKIANVVQRQWEEHTGVQGHGAGGGSSQEADDGANSPLDLEALAEDVFPYVKRILEIESGRNFGNLR